MKILVLSLLCALLAVITWSSVFAQSDEKTFTNTKFGLSMKYPSDWTFIIQEEDLSSQLYDDSMVLPAGVTNIGDFCPSSEIEDNPELFDCQIKSAAHFGITAYKLKPGTNLKKLSNQESPDNVFLTTNLGTFNIEISGIPAIQEVHTVRPNPAHSDIDTLFNEVGRGETKEMNTYLVNGNVGYLLHVEADNKESYDKYFPTFEKMIDSFLIQGATID